MISEPSTVTATPVVDPTYIDLTSIATPVNTYMTSYTVEVSSTQDTRDGFPRTFDGNTDASFNASDLIPATLYTIKVTAKCDDVLADALEFTNIVTSKCLLIYRCVDVLQFLHPVTEGITFTTHSHASKFDI